MPDGICCTSAHCSKCHVGQPNPNDTEEKWFQTSLKALREKFPKELIFVILTPSFKTLRQQTFDRLLKAGLANAGREHLVVPCIWAGKVRQGAGSHQLQLAPLGSAPAEFTLPVSRMQGDISKFHESAREDLKRLHVMVVDECHYAATLGQAHDAFVNEFKWQDAGGACKWAPCKGSERKRHPAAGAILEQENMVTLLVSATPYCVLSKQSRIPYMPLKVSAECQDVACLTLTLMSADVRCASNSVSRTELPLLPAGHQDGAQCCGLEPLHAKSPDALLEHRKVFTDLSQDQAAATCCHL